MLCRPEVAAGFELAGLAPVRAGSDEEAADRAEQLRADPTPAVLLVQASLWEALPDRLRSGLEAAPLPMIVPFPDPSWEERPTGEAYLVELLRRSIGYRVRLR